MSANPVEAPPVRLQRSELAVPGSNTRFIEKAAQSAADVVFLDCEDAVAPEEKEQARRNIVAALNEVDWGAKTVMVRVNGLDSEWMYRDVVDIVEACPRLDMLLIPKVGVAADLYALDVLVSQIEQAKRRAKRIGFEALIETALGMANVEVIACSSTRLEAMSFGAADYAASTHARTTGIGAAHPDYGVLTERDENGERRFHWADMWHYAQNRLLVACRAHGLRPVDGPFGDYGDPDGFTAAARRAAALGFEGKWAIHPSQIVLANEVFSPAADEVEHANRVLEAMRAAQAQGKGAVSLDGRLLDIASIRMAENVIAKADAIARR